jgi:hypothetical protein
MENTEKKEVNGVVSAEQIALWKAKHRKVYAVEVVDGDDTYIGYFHRPGMDTMAAVNKLSKTDEIKAACALFENCWLGGSAYLIEDAVLKMAAVSKLNALMNVTSVELKNL